MSDILTVKQELTSTIATDIVILCLDIYEPDKFSVYDLLKDLVSENENKLYKITLSEGLQQPVYDEDDDIVNWSKSKMLPEPQGAHPINHYLEQFKTFEDDGIFVIEDWQGFLGEQNPNLMTLSLIKEICQQREQNTEYVKKIVLLGHNVQLLPEIFRQIPVFNIPLPSKKAIASELYHYILSYYFDGDCKKVKLKASGIEKLAIAANGLTFFELSIILQKYQAKNKTYHFENLNQAILERKYTILKSLGVEFLDSPDLPDVGGHDRFKDWIKQVAVVRELGDAYGIPQSNGCLLCGQSGTGKTLLAKAIAKSWNVPLLVLNLAALKGSLVGQSENNLKRALAAIDHENAVVLIDEIEKCVNSGVGDNTGVSSGMLSILLWWMQENKNNFIVATANNVKALPAELLRAGRLDRRWYVELPNETERQEIIRIHLTRLNRCSLSKKKLDDLISLLGTDTQGFSGAELEQLVIQALTKALVEKRPAKPTFADFRSVLGNIKVLSQAFPEQHRAIAEWSKNAESTSVVG